MLGGLSWLYLGWWFGFRVCVCMVLYMFCLSLFVICYYFLLICIWVGRVCVYGFREFGVAV